MTRVGQPEVAPSPERESARAPAHAPGQAPPTSAQGREEELQKEVTLLELLDRVLDKGVVLSGDITLSVADVDLIYVGLRVLLSSVEAAQRHLPANGRDDHEGRSGREGPGETPSPSSPGG